MRTIYFTENYDFHADGAIYAYSAGYEIEVEDDIADAVLEAGAGYEVHAEDDED